MRVTTQTLRTRLANTENIPTTVWYTNEKGKDKPKRTASQS